MAHEYKTFSIHQLQEEEEVLKGKLAQAKQDGIKNRIAIYSRKIEVVRSFMLDPKDFQPGDTFELIEDPDHLFEINEVKGVFVWGYRINRQTNIKLDEEGFLLVMLGEKV